MARQDVVFPESMTDETKANYSIYDVDDLDFLHSTFQGFPMFAYMNVTVTPLAKHPNATTDDFFRQR